jgi:hypothetical protein
VAAFEEEMRQAGVDWQLTSYDSNPPSGAQLVVR